MPVLLAAAASFCFGKYWWPFRILEFKDGSAYETGCFTALPDLRVPSVAGSSVAAEGGTVPA